MIISKTPFRISFFGGGTDYPVWYRENGGAVLSTTIDKYCYITCRYLPPFFNHKHHIVYSRDEKVNNVDEIKHPAVREILKFMNLKDGLEIHYDADLPARSGLGSSSSFTVGLLHSLYALKKKDVSKNQLASEAIHIEQNLIKENVGSQDQIAAAFGGLNKIKFNKDNTFEITPVIITKERLRELEEHIMFYFTGLSRTASDIAEDQIKKTPQKKIELAQMYEMVDEAISILTNNNSAIDEFGKLLHESWRLKRSLTDKISTKVIDDIYDSAYNAGALGGKLTGAGGGGFMLIFAKPEVHPRIKDTLKNLLYVPVQIDKSGSEIIFYDM
ncbi:MAG: kinase [Candidatus Cloacimonetes bacterium]|nr:kinase [Candidatus Cloacimonadota bacterium]